MATINVQIAISVVIIFVTVLGFLVLKKLRKQKLPQEWQQIGTVKNLTIYPLKSGKGIEYPTLDITERGAKELEQNDKGLVLRDRCFLIYTAKDREVRTARQLPKTVLIQIKAAQNGVILSIPNKKDIFISVPKIKNNVTVILKWGMTFGNETFRCTDCGEDVARWLSNFLLNKDEGLRLGYGDGSAERDVLGDHKKWAQYYTNMDNKMVGIFSDLAALHLVNEATIEDLNKHLPNEQQVTYKNFRPNILIEGVEKFAEDNWKYLKIGEVVTKVCLECLRCIETTVSSDGVMNKDREPVKTLEQYRKSDGPFKYGKLGTYLMVLKTGKIRKGDPIYIPSKF